MLAAALCPARGRSCTRHIFFNWIYGFIKMLDLVNAEHFRQLQGQVCQFEIHGGEILHLRVDRVTLKPLARMPDADEGGRMPFSVGLTAMQPSGFVHGLCSVELPQLGRVCDMMVAREAALGRDPGQSYFQILFG